VIVLQTNRFRKSIKKFHTNQKTDLDDAVRAITAKPSIGDAKIGDLSGVYVFKFQMMKQLTLIAYTYDEETITLTLLAVGSHENFYRDIK
jgi:mRNA-degrading endonuclease RelE of RelBE toxin-antitoxin system